MSEIISPSLAEIAAGLICGDAEEVSRLTRMALDCGMPALRILEESLIAGMRVVGNRFREGEICVPEVLIAARAMKAGIAHLDPVFRASGIKPVGKFLIGTVKGDVHDIGKNLVGIMLIGAGFEVIDLGTNVSADKFIEAVRIHQPDIVGMSALLTTTMMQMKTTIQALRKERLLETVKVMVGGAPVTEKFAREIGADGYGPTAADAAENALALVGR